MTLASALADTFEPEAFAAEIRAFDGLNGGNLAERVAVRIDSKGGEIMDVRTTEWKHAGTSTVGGRGTGYGRVRFTHELYERTVRISAAVRPCNDDICFVAVVTMHRYGANGRIRLSNEPVSIGINNNTARLDFSTSTESILVWGALGIEHTAA